MALSISVRRGVEIGPETPITTELLRLLALPTVSVEGDVGSQSIADNSVSAAKLQTNAVEEAKINTGAVTETKIANSAVTNAKLGPGAVTVDKVTPGAYSYAAGVYSVGVYAITLSPALASYAAGVMVKFIPDTTNTAGAVNINVNGLGSKDLFKGDGLELAAGDLRSGKPACAIYDGTRFVLVSPVGNLESVPGGTTAGTSSAFTLSFTGTLFPVLVALYSGCRLRVKFHVANAAGPTLAVDGLTAKQVRSPADLALPADALLASVWYELVYDTAANGGSGAWIVANGDLSSGNLSMPSVGSSITFAHGLGRVPRMMRVVMVRTYVSNDYLFNNSTGFPINQYDEIELTSFHIHRGDDFLMPAFQIRSNATNVLIAMLTNSGDAYPAAYTGLGGGGSDAAENQIAQGVGLSSEYALKVYYQ